MSSELSQKPLERSVGTYLSVCAIYRNEGPYFREWIEFHRLVGVERFFLYNNESEDEHREVLAPYIHEGIVTVYDWPFHPGEGKAYDHCVATHRNDSRWIAFLDLDEFLFSPTGLRLPEVLADYEKWAGVGVNRATYGTSGHLEKPDGLVIESYVWCGHDDNRHNRKIKNIVDPTRVVGYGDPHHFLYSDGFVVDENHVRLASALTDKASFSRLRINHYWTRSMAEFRKKFSGNRADTGRPRRPPGVKADLERMNGRVSVQRDESILGYVPALRSALERRELSSDRQD